MGKLDGKVAVVTGSGRGLGRGYAIGMANEGCAIVINDVDESATAVVKEIKDSGGKAAAVIGGVGIKETADKLVSTAVHEFGKLDILVNNAGITRDGLFVRLEEKQWDDVIFVHLRGTFINSQAVAKYWIDNKIRGGRLINITSSAGIYGNLGQSNYSAAKAGIIGLTKSNSIELARFGITVNAVAPLAETEMTKDIPPHIKEEGDKRYAKMSTIGKVGNPEDVVPLIVFLASDDSYYVTGQVICAQGTTGLIVT
jgi:3-oxoacyl-[acyl-carrier protein] reductase